MNLYAIEQWAKSALDDYHRGASTDQPEYPQIAADVLDLVGDYRLLSSYSEMQAASARIRSGINQKQQACPDCHGSGKQTCEPQERCNLCAGKGVV